MSFCLIRNTSGQGASGQQAHGTLLNGSRLTIGSAADQFLHIPVAGVERRHAVITVTPEGWLLLTVRSARGVTVNGASVHKAHLSPGDRLQIGAATITLERPRRPGLFVLHVEEPDGGPRGIDQGQAGLPLRFWSWTFTLAVTVLCLLISLAGAMVPAVGWVLRNTPLLPSDSLWNPGPLHAAHQSIGTDCNACHRRPFEKVRDDECAVCHADVQHHVDARSADARLFDGRECASCHREHKQPAALVQSDPRLCTDCHRDLEHLKSAPRVADVTDFGHGHPEFRLTVLAGFSGGDWRPVRLDRARPESFGEHSHLKFSHQQHLDPKGVKSPQGERVLVCQDCHRPDPSGRQMAPIRMTTACSGCHSLRFDEEDPASALPHSDLAAAIKAVREHFSRQYLERGLPEQPGDGGLHRRPGGSGLAQPGADQTAVAWVDEQTFQVTRGLMEKRVCFECHEVVHLPGRTGVDQWRIRPVRLTSDWMPLARFNHAAHGTQKCTVCHGAAERSQRATDILIPSIAKCRECHGGAEDTSKVASTCLMCHQFHLPNRGPFLTAATERPR